MPEFDDSKGVSAEPELASTETGISIQPGEEIDGLEPDHIAPLGAYSSVPVVGLGGSAGSIPFLQNFFAHTAADTGSAYVVVVHLSPEHESTLAEVLQRSAKIPVIQVNQTMTVKPNTVYVIPPAKKLSMKDGQISVSDLERQPGRRVTVDIFFRTLADTHGPRACAIVLSGADSDGSIGIKRMKERGGLTIVQDPVEAMYDGMPRAAIATGMVDWILPVRDMPAQLAAYRENEKRIVVPVLADPVPTNGEIKLAPDGEEALQQVLSLLRVNTSRDFSYYKRPTVLRRILRRMQVNGVADFSAYLAFLRSHPGETSALLQDLLISVTNFFRDGASFEALEGMIPKLFDKKGPGDEVRVWVPGCATGEEAYTIAMLLAEHAAKLESPPHIQVFATDLDEQAIRAAREGAYPEVIAADVSEERLRQFFVKDHGLYRVKPPLRGMVLFAVHDVLRDPPFSRLDLISCRNLLIYLHRNAQGKAFEIFHFALSPEGRLFLGSSESIDETTPLFQPIDKAHRLYARRPLARNGYSAYPNRPLLPFERKDLPKLLNPVLPSALSDKISITAPSGARSREASLADLHFKLLDPFAPASLIVDQNYDIVHLSNKAGRYLQFGGGEPSMNLLRVVDPSLRLDLRGALFRASQADASVELSGIPIVIDGESHLVDVSVIRNTDVAPDYLMVLFREQKEAVATSTLALLPRSDAMIELEKEIEHLKTQLRDTVYQYDSGAEELKASNEELQAMNEELRSATEELETSREELQSVNEELSTVNQELKGKVDEVSRGASDLQNLMFSTNIATIFLDRELRIKRYTPASVALFNLIPTDFGRPLSDLTPKLEYPDVSADATQVLQQLTPIERETRSTDGRHYLARLLPYRTAEDQIAGVVLTFVDITQLKQAEESLRMALLDNQTARTEIEASAAAKDNFLAMLSHELRTPLTPVMVTVNALIRRTDLSQRVREGLEMIQRNVEIESRFIDDLLDLTRISRRKFEIVRNPVDMNAVIHDAIEVSKNDIEAKQQKLNVSLSLQSCTVIGDAMRLQQVVWNLLKNASKFAPNGGKIEVSSHRDRGSVLITVDDDGVGIEPDMLPRIFDAFAQGGVDVTRDYGGLGLGLAISKATIDAHGGTISARSPGRNHGATFIVSLPLQS